MPVSDKELSWAARHFGSSLWMKFEASQGKLY